MPDQISGNIQFGYDYYTLACPVCSRRIFVELGLFGSPHHTRPTVTCGECIKLPLRDEYVRDHPQAAGELLNWLKEMKNVDL